MSAMIYMSNSLVTVIIALILGNLPDSFPNFILYEFSNFYLFLSVWYTCENIFPKINFSYYHLTWSRNIKINKVVEDKSKLVGLNNRRDGVAPEGDQENWS